MSNLDHEHWRILRYPLLSIVACDWDTEFDVPDSKFICEDGQPLRFEEYWEASQHLNHNFTRYVKEGQKGPDMFDDYNYRIQMPTEDHQYAAIVQVSVYEERDYNQDLWFVDEHDQPLGFSTEVEAASWLQEYVDPRWIAPSDLPSSVRQKEFFRKS